jgi:prevent-host-death family protein
MDLTKRELQNMPKTMSVSEAKNKLSAMLQWAVENQDEVIVESHGQPKAVILPYDEYEALAALRRKARRQEALAQMQALAAKVQAGNQDLSAEEVEQMADEITRETIERLTSEGKVSFTQS